MNSKWIDQLTGEPIELGDFVTAHLVEEWTGQGALISDNVLLLEGGETKEIKEVVCKVQSFLLDETRKWAEYVKWLLNEPQ